MVGELIDAGPTELAAPLLLGATPEIPVGKHDEAGVAGTDK
jgi:hypothetical protein